MGWRRKSYRGLSCMFDRLIWLVDMIDGCTYFQYIYVCMKKRSAQTGCCKEAVSVVREHRYNAIIFAISCFGRLWDGIAGMGTCSAKTMDVG